MQEVIIISLIITGVYVSFMEGMIFGWFRIACANMFDKAFGLAASRYIQKPLWDCLPCMASIWTCLITWSVDLLLILAVCGMNFIIEKTFFYDDEPVADQ